MVEYTELTDLDDDKFLCKLLWTHAMDLNPSPQFIDGEIARMATRIQPWRCSRCGRERYDYLDSRGRLIGRYYKNPEDYPRTHGFSGDELRAESLRRNLGFKVKGSKLLGSVNGKKR